MQQISSNIYVETGFRGSNDGFVITSEGLVMIDAPHKPTDAVKWREEIAKKGEVRYLINTEPHIDHYTGNHFFSGTVISHEGTRRAILAKSKDELIDWVRRNDPSGLPLMDKYQIRIPTITFSERLSFHLGEHTFELIHLPGHTWCQIGVYIHEEKVLFTGDNVGYKVQAFLHECDPFQWLRSLAIIELMDVDVIVPGHGDVCDRSCIPELSSFIREWVDTVRKAIHQGLTKEEAMNKISFLDRYPWPIGLDAMGPEFQRKSVARLYDLLRT